MMTPMKQPATGLVIATAGAWLALAVLSLFGVRLANYSVLGLAAWLLTGLAALVLPVVAAVLAMRSRRLVLAAATLVLSAAAGTAIVRTDWESLYVHAFYRLYASDFATVAALATDGRLKTNDMYGPLLPGPVRHLAANGRAAPLASTSGGPAGVFLAHQLRIPDGGAGFALIAADRAGETFDCFLDQCRVRWSLGAGWVLGRVTGCGGGERTGPPGRSAGSSSGGRPGI